MLFRSDTARDENSVTMALASGYVLASATGSGASQTVTATSWDQYGVGIASNSLGMTLTGTGSDKGLAVGQTDEGTSAITNTFTTTRTTNSSGVATWGVSRDSAVSGSSTFRVNDSEDNNDVESMYWTNLSSSTAVGDEAASAPNVLVTDTDFATATADTNVGAQIVGLDAANDLLIVAIRGYKSTDTTYHTRYVQYSYDDNDAYTLVVNSGTVYWDRLGFETYVGLGQALTAVVGADSRYVVPDNLDVASAITINNAALTSVFVLDLVG